jgi:outer membrane cobalamin receptor
MKGCLLPKYLEIFAVTLLLLLSAEFGAWANATAPIMDAADVYEEETVVVTATRTKQEESKAPGKTEVITEEEIEASGAATVAEALTGLGVLISSYGGASGSATVQLDGATAEQTLVLMNGVPVNSGTGGYVDLSYFPTAGIKRIEIVHGPLSALYGANALGGVVNIITDLTGTAVNQAALTGGSNSYSQLDLAVKQQQYGLAVGGFTTDDHRENSATKTGYLMGQYDFYRTDQAELRLNLLYNSKDYENPGSTAYPLISDSLRKSLAIDLNGKNGGDQFTVEYKLYLQRNNLDYNDDFSQNRYQTDIWGGDWAGGYQIAAHQLLGGFQLQQARLSRDDVEKTWHTGALFVQDNWQIGPQWQLVSGVRWDTGSVFSSPVCPRFGLNYAVSDRFTVKLGYGKAFRAPTFDDLYYPDDGTCKGNPDLKPETGDRYEITGEWRSGFQIFGLNCFTAKVADGIAWKFINDAYSPINIDKMKIKGCSLSWRNQWNEYLSTVLKYTRTDRQSWSDITQSYSGDENYFGKNRYTLNLGYQLGAWLVNLDWNRVTDRNGGRADYAVLDWHIKYRMNARLDYALTIKNLTGKAYEVHTGYPMPGREYYLSANYSF